jgi:hypothetical protein
MHASNDYNGIPATVQLASDRPLAPLAASLQNKNGSPKAAAFPR